MKISALVVIYNQQERLRQCLGALKGFDEVVVVDIGSNDHSADIAREMGITVVSHPWVPIGEMVLPAIMPTLNNDWIFRVDPDEIVPTSLVHEIIELEISEDYAVIAVPYQYYFRNKRLDHTVWGGIGCVGRIIHRHRIQYVGEVHAPYHNKPGYEMFSLPYNEKNAVEHYWVDSYSQLFSKHERYLKLEGQARYSQGQRFSWVKLISRTKATLKASLVGRSGWRGGWTGWFLSFFYAQYEMRGWLALRKYEHLHKEQLG